MTTDPFRRPPMIDIPWGERERWWQRATEQLSRPNPWRDAQTFDDLCERAARFCEGKLDRTPGHYGPREPETVGIAALLAHANRRGFLTTGSQPGEDDNGHQQRAFVDGWAMPETVQRLRALVWGTRLSMRVTPKLPRRTDTSDAVDVTRRIYPDGTAHVFTDFGALPSRSTPGLDYDRPDLVDGASYVQIYDPEWGDRSLLWDRLAEPDWDNPSPPSVDPPKTPTTPARPTAALTSTGAGMTNIDEARAAIMKAHQDGESALAALGQAHEMVEDTQRGMRYATEGSNQAEADQAHAQLADALQKIDEARQQVAAALAEFEGVGQRL